MNKSIKLTAISIAMSATIMLSNCGLCAGTATKTSPPAKKQAETQINNIDAASYETIMPMDLVANPQKYLNKQVKFTAQFAQFSTLGLDYPPVNKTSKDYIALLIKRPDTAGKDYTIPLSELKLLIKRNKAEKLIDLESGNRIEIMGKVISTALGDPWMEVDQIIMLDAKPVSAKKVK